MLWVINVTVQLRFPVVSQKAFGFYANDVRAIER